MLSSRPLSRFIHQVFPEPISWPNQTSSELKGLGPQSRQLLARLGIVTVAQLRELGSVACYVRAKQADPKVSLNLLWGLESVLTGEHWRVVARVRRASLLLALEERQRT